MEELELNLQVPPAAQALLRAEFRRRGAQRVHLRAHYHDTPNDDLARLGLSLRLRREGRHWVQTLKSVTESAACRGEDNVALVVPPGTRPRLDPARHAASAAGAALRRALADIDAETALVERCVTDVWRHRCEVQLDGARIEVALDIGSLAAGVGRLPIFELEFELMAGDVAMLVAWVRSWAGERGLWLNTVSKAHRGLAWAQGERFMPPAKARAPHLTANLDGACLLRRVLGAALEQVLANASAIGWGSTEVEHLHQLRVGLRRVRTALRELGPLGTGVDVAWEAQLARSFAALGALRDDQAVAAAVRPLLERAGAPLLVWTGTPSSIGVREIVCEPGFQKLLVSLLGFSLDECRSGGGVDAVVFVAARLEVLRSRLRRAAQQFEALAPAEQHRQRRRLKRLRYLAEFVADLFEHEAVNRSLCALEPAQEALGRRNDVAVAAARFRAEAAHDPRADIAAGVLEAHLHGTAREAGHALRAALKAPRFWRH